MKYIAAYCTDDKDILIEIIEAADEVRAAIALCAENCVEPREEEDEEIRRGLEWPDDLQELRELAAEQYFFFNPVPLP